MIRNFFITDFIEWLNEQKIVKLYSGTKVNLKNNNGTFYFPPEKNFDFEKVHKAMVNLEWVWYDDGLYKTPSIKDLKRTAKELIKQIKKADVDVISTGGFEVRKNKDTITLQFVLASSDVEDLL